MTDTVNIFEQATRQKLRFDTPAHTGLSVEQLWELPLTTIRANASSLDNAGKVILKALREQEEESLVTPAATGPKAELQLKLAVVKHIIDTKQAENAAKVAETERAQQRETIRALLTEKHADELKGLSKDELEARLKQLGG